MLIQQTQKKKCKHKILAWFTLAMIQRDGSVVSFENRDKMIVK